MPDPVTNAATAATTPAQAAGLQVADLQAAVGVLADLVKGLVPADVTAPVATTDAASASASASSQPEAQPQSPAATIADVLADAPGIISTVTATDSRLRSSRLWTTIGTIGALGIGHFAGLPPLTQGYIAGLAALYMILRTIKGAVHA